MDTITHGIAGALVGKAFFTEKAPASEAGPAGASGVAIWAATLGAVFPDADVLFEVFGNNDLAVIEQHRGFSHSLLCLPLFAVALAGLTRWAARRHGSLCPSFGRLTLIYAAGLALHVLLDLLTSFGTMIWSPLANTRVAWDVTFIIDFVFTGIVLVPQAAAWVYRRREGGFTRALAAWALLSLAAVGAERLARGVGVAFSPWAVVVASGVFAAVFFLPMRRGRGFGIRRGGWCRAGAGALAAYLAVCAAAHHVALRRVEEFARARSLGVEHRGAIPMPPSLAQWMGLIRTPEGVYRARFSLRGGAPEFEFIADAPGYSFIEAARSLPKVRSFLWFARFPSVSYREAAGFHIVEFADLRFFARGRRSAGPFTFRVVFNAAGEAVEQGWLEQ